MVNYKIVTLLSSSLIVACAATNNNEQASNENQVNDWQAIALPAAVLAKGEWQLKEQNSDSFAYSGKNSAFFTKWHDNHMRGWLGPGATYFNAEHSDVIDGKLVLSAAPVPPEKQGKVKNYGKFNSKKTVFTGFVTAKETITYPVYVEASLKISKLALANNFWMLSDDDRNEIDVTETYGDSKKNASHMSSNYHIFKRDPVSNHMLGDYGHKQGFHETANKDVFYDDYHRFGFYWQSPTYMEFYLDGNKVRVLSVDDKLNDPEGKYMDRAMRLIFDMEDHVWRAVKGITPTEAQLNNAAMNKMYIDWIRTYKPVEK
ncbi:MAG: family 16 glycosylhydrolase [Thalassotalea sp.]